MADSSGNLDDFLASLRPRVVVWPLPLAYPAERCLHWVSSPAALVNWSFKLFGQSLRLTSLYLAGAYLAGEIARTDINTAIQEDLRRPLLGKWRGFLRDTVERLASQSDDPLIQAVQAFHSAIGVRRDSPGPPTLRDGHIVRTPTTVVDAILETRNTLEHGPRGIDDDMAADLLSSLSPLMKRLVEAFDSLQGFQLTAVANSGKETSLHGPDPPQLDEDHVCQLVDPAGNRLPLNPLALIDLMGETGLQDESFPVDLLLYDGRQEKRLRYIGLHKVQDRKDSYSDFSIAMERKAISARLQDPVASWNRQRLVEALALRQFQLEADGRAPSPPEIAVPRNSLQQRLLDFFNGPSTAVLLTGFPGAGRSALLAQSTRQLLAQGIPAACFSASILAPLLDFGSLGELLPKILILQAKFEDLISLADRPAGTQGLTLAIDALESVGPVEKLRKLLNNVEDLCRAYRGHGLKLLIAIQSQALARALDESPPLDEQIWFHSVVKGFAEEPLSVPELPVEELLPNEAESLYRAHCENAGLNAPHTPWELLPPIVRERLREPGFNQQFVIIAGRQHIRHDEVLISVEKALLERKLFGRRYDPRRRKYVDAFPGRKRLLEKVATSLIAQRSAEVSIQVIEDPEEEYLEILASGALHEIARVDAGDLVVRFANPASFAAIAADVLISDHRLLEELLVASDMQLACGNVPGLEMAIAEALAVDLDRPSSLAVRLLQQNPTEIQQRIISAALLRFAEMRPTRIARALGQLHRFVPLELLENLIGHALDENKLFFRPEAAAALAESVRGSLPVTLSKNLLKLSRALRRAAKTQSAEEILRIVPSDATPLSEAKRVYLLGSILRDSGRWQEAVDLLTASKAAYETLGSRDGLLLATASLAETLSLLDRHEEAAQALDRAEPQGKGASLETELQFKVKHAMSLRMRGLLRKAYSRCEEVLLRATSARLLPLVARAETEMGIIHSLLDDAPGAVRFLNRAIVTKRQLGDNHGLKQAYLCLGFAHAMAGNTEAARDAYEQSRSLNRDTDDVYGELLTLEFLLRLSPELAGRSELIRAVTLANRVAEWKNPRIQAILDTLNRRLSETQESGR